MRTLKDIESYENDLGDRIYGTPYTEEEKNESRKSFIDSLKKAVKAGGSVKVFRFKNKNGDEVKQFDFKLKNSNLRFDQNR